MRFLTKAASLAVALVVSATAAGAQGVTFSTTGQFTSPGPTCNDAIAATIATCSGAGFSLTFTGTDGINVGNGSITSLGQFLLAGTGDASVEPGIVGFRLNVNQTIPSSGTGVFIGSISGSVTTTDGNISKLIWTPNEFAPVDGVMYQLVFDQVGPAAGVGLGIPINNQRGINALVTVTPEPASMMLLGTGLVGVFGAARRRKSQRSA